jgi:transcriptional regulator EpsA
VELQIQKPSQSPHAAINNHGQDRQPHFSFSADEHNVLMQIIQQSLHIRERSEMFMWLHGDLQRFVPHETLIAAWGNIGAGQLGFSIISSRSDHSEELVAPQAIARFIRECFNRWVSNSCHPVILKTGTDLGGTKGHGSRAFMAPMCSAVIHGLEGHHGDGNYLYIALDSRMHFDAATQCRSAELTVPFIDVTLRKVRRNSLMTEYKFDGETVTKQASSDSFGLSDRELEVMKWVQFGKTNQEIGMILSISIFTVKNHLRHVFEKLNVVNRTQAVAKLIVPQGNLRADAH